jgi:archaellin
MTVLIALAAAVLAGAGLVLQQRAAEQVPKALFCGCGCSLT